MAKTQTAHPRTPEVKYDEDLYAWAINNAELLRQGRLNAIDVDNIAEELETLAGNQRRELRSRLTVLIMHLLKWRYQPELQRRSWRVTIDTQRDELHDLLEDSPSLKSELDALTQKVYPRSVRKVAYETGIDPENFPPACPWGSEQIPATEFWPE